MGGGEEWGGADCHIKDLHCEGNVGTEGNCYACYDGDSGKYLWGNACHAKKFGKNEYETGVCGKEYTCITDGRDIGSCPYNDYCPSKRSFEVSIGAEACDSYCESWDKFMKSKKDDNTQEEICDMYKSKRCRTCQDVQNYCGWKIQCSGNVGDEGNCYECYNGYNGKYLWGNTCHAKKFGKDEYERGVCGKEYTCITDGKDIGECPYDDYCPSA